MLSPVIYARGHEGEGGGETHRTLNLSRWLLGSLVLRDAGAGVLLGPPGPARLHKARPCGHLFLPHSCRHGIYEDVWHLAKGGLCIKPAALPPGRG